MRITSPLKSRKNDGRFWTRSLTKIISARGRPLSKPTFTTSHSGSSTLVSILGTTATGKTSLALKLAVDLIDKKVVSGVKLISADSRQVYQGLKITSGADIPSEFSCQASNQQPARPNYDYFSHQKLPIELHGVSIIQPNQDWSLTYFRNLALTQIKQAWKQNWLPIIVGGTGLYHHHLLNNDPELYVKPNSTIRSQAASKSLAELQTWLNQVDSDKLAQMNHSDQHNPRRLIRAIEVSLAMRDPCPRIKNRPQLEKPASYLQFVLDLPERPLHQKIRKRVEERLENGALKEVKALLKLNLKPTSQAMTTTGVPEIVAYLESSRQEKNRAKLISAWTQTELQYAKRQKTWFKKAAADAPWFEPWPQLSPADYSFILKACLTSLKKSEP
ncbi:MAG: hypothetical protein GF381_00735 [Candidatus Pacebacteria bacterium]|nr:hypothetical protein [Candidatus Paceibacterota bacterium]